MIDTDSIADGAITTDKIADKAVTNAKLACDSVGSCQIQDGAVTLEKTTGLIPYVTEQVGNESRARASAINQLQSRIAQVDASAVKTITVNSGGKHYPDNAGNVNLVIGQGGGGGEDLARQVAANTEAISELQDAVGELAREGETMKPFAEKLSEEFAPDIEQMGYAGLGGEVVWSPFYAQFLLRVTSDGETKYYSAWNGNDDRIPSEAYEDPSDGFWYIQTENGAQLYHWEPGVVDLLPISGNGVLDDALDESSENTVKNHVIYEAVLSLRNRIAPLERDEKILPLAGVNYGSPENLQSYGYEGDRGDIYYYPALKRFYLTAVSGGAGARVLKSYSAWVACGAYRSNEDYVLEKNFYYFVDGDEIHILHWSASGNKMVELTKGETGSSVIRAYDWSDLESRKTDGWEVGKYWYDTDNYVLKQCVSVQPLSFTTIRDLHLVLNPKDGKIYEIDSAEEDLPRLLDTGDLNDIKDEIAQAVGNTGDTPMGAIVNGVTTENAGLSAFASGYVYDLVWDKAIKTLLLRCREVLTWYEPAIDSGARRIPKTFGSTTYYRIWSVRGKAPDYVPYSASDFELKAKEDYLNDAELERSGVKGFFYTTDGDDGLVVWKWDAAAGDLVATRGGGSVAVETSGNTLSINGNDVPFATVNGQPVLGGGAIVIEGNEPAKLYSNSDSVLYPEHFGAKGDGIDFYDWPLVCFGGTTNEALTDGGTLAGVYVPAPGDRLFGEIKNIAVDEAKGQLVYSKDALGLSLTSADVVYSSASNKFFLRYSGSYYSRWGNSYIWNDETNNRPRIDTVYSDISLDEESTRFRQAKRISYVYRPSAGTINGHAYSAGMVDIDTLMTDDTEAFYTWLNRAKNGCALRLTKGKIYYVRPKSSSASPLFENVDFKGNEVDFGGAVIFARRSDAGWPHNSHWEGDTFIGNTASMAVPWLIKLRYCRNLTLKNVTVRALADRDVSCPASGSYALLSASSGAMNFIEIEGLEQESVRDVSLYNENIRLVNINLRNMYHDILIGVYHSEDQLRSLTVDGWKSTGAFGNALRGRKIQISHADITTKKYLGGAGFHVFYVQERVRDCVMRDSIFRQPDMFNEVGMAFHYLDYGNLVFEGCHFEMGRFTYGGASACSIDFRGCTFKQITKYYLGSGALQLNDGGAFVLSRIKYKFDNTVIHLISQRGFDCSSAQTLTLLDTSVLYPEPDANGVYTQPEVVLFYNFSGTAIVKHFTTNYRAAIGININDYDAEQRNLILSGIVTTNDRIDAIRGLVSGDVEIFDGDPLNPAVNDVWYNTKAEETRKCTTAGEPAVVGWNIRKLSTFAEAYTGLSTLFIAPKESIAFDYADLTKEEFHGFLREVLTKNGYVEVFDKEALRSGEAKFYLHVPTGDTNYLMIRTKTAGVNVDSISSTGYSSVSDPRPFFNTYARRRGTSDDRVYWAMDGSPFQYTTDFTASGLLPKVEKLEQSSGLALVPDFVQTTAPQSANAGQTWFDTTNGAIKRYNGNTWVGADGEGVTRVVYASSKLYLCVASNVVKEIALNDLSNS